MAADNQALEKATLGGGCFWCLEAVFDQLEGVHEASSGYSGGHVKNPSYKAVCTGETGHAEVIQVAFDPEVISFTELLEVFFSIHDPTTLNRQGNDIGTQYRSAIFYHTEDQKSITGNVIQKLTESRVYKNPIVTEVEPFDIFYKAEDYHQEYFANNGSQPYCQLVVAPKVKKFKEAFQNRLKDK